MAIPALAGMTDLDSTLILTFLPDKEGDGSN